MVLHKQQERVIVRMLLTNYNEIAYTVNLCYPFKSMNSSFVFVYFKLRSVTAIAFEPDILSDAFGSSTHRTDAMQWNDFPTL